MHQTWLSVLGVGALVLVMTAGANGSAAAPPKYYAANNLKGGMLIALPNRRACGPAQAVVRVGATTYVLRGGNCETARHPTNRRAGSGPRHHRLVRGWSDEPGHRFLVVAAKATAAGRFKIAETSLEAPGTTNFLERAFVTVSKVLNSGTFSFVDSRSATRITGSFTCR